MTKLNERDFTYLTEGGHTHDGIDSTAVKPAPKTIQLEMLSDSLIAWILSLAGQGDSTATGTIGPIDDLTITPALIAVGDTTIGAADWASLCLVRYINITSTPDSQCDITFYHTDSYSNPDREFVAQNCIDEFLWEGTWVHKDDTDLNKLYWSIKNTGSVDAIFSVTLKACGVG